MPLCTNESSSPKTGQDLTGTNMKSLRATLTYKNDELILRIQKALHVNRIEACRVFADVKTWLWLCARHREVSQKKDIQSYGYRLHSLAMLEHFMVIDIGWHEFILMTKAYHDFCRDYFDGYIHHFPAPTNAVTLQKVKRVQTTAYLIRYLSFMEQEIGQRRLERWLTSLPKMPAEEQRAS